MLKAESNSPADAEYEMLEDMEEGITQDEISETNSKQCCSSKKVFTLLEIAVPLLTIGQLLVLKYRDVVMPACPSKLMVAVTPLLACETLLVSLMILSVTVLSFYQEEICGKLANFKPTINVLPALFFAFCGNIFLLSTGGLVVVLENVSILLHLKTVHGCYDSTPIAAGLASVMLLEYVCSFCCLILLARKAFRLDQMGEIEIYGNGRIYVVALVVYMVGFTISQIAAAKLISDESKFGLYFLTPSTQIDFLFEHICIYICAIAIQCTSWDMTLLSLVAATESMIIKWIALHIDTYFFNMDCSLNETECTMNHIVWTGSLLRNVGFTLLACGVVYNYYSKRHLYANVSDTELTAPINGSADDQEEKY